jgi:hypothetical protein
MIPAEKLLRITPFSFAMFRTAGGGYRIVCSGLRRLPVCRAASAGMQKACNDRRMMPQRLPCACRRCGPAVFGQTAGAATAACSRIYAGGVITAVCRNYLSS